MKAMTFLLLPLAALLVTGCVGLVVPLPSSGGKAYGHAVTPAQVKFIVPGQTTRAEVVREFGGPGHISLRQPALAYTWEEPAADLLWFWIIPFPPGAGDGGCVERAHWRAFFVAFDAAGKVSRTQFILLAGGRSLDEQLDRWAVRDREACRVAEIFFDADSGAPIFVQAALDHLGKRYQQK